MNQEIYIDGSGFNGFKCKYSVAFDDGRTIIEKFNNKRTNNEMEYEALIRALQECKEKAVIYTDSQLVLNQVMGKWKIKQNHLFGLVTQAKQLLDKKHANIQWIPREQNKPGHLLEK